MSKKHLFISAFLLLFLSVGANAQVKKNPFVVNLSEDGKQFIKFGGNVQLWSRYTELNPGSKVGSNTVSGVSDIVIRRIRLQALGMLTPKVFFHLQIGTNNVNFSQNHNAPISALDFLGEYHFAKYLHIGLGLNGWGAGVSRYSAQSSSSQLTLDAPIYQQYNISSTFGNRALSMYAKGEIKKLNYVVAVTNPYKVSTNNLNMNSTVSTLTPNAQFLGRVTYQFFDKESIAEPYSKATYLGKKKILNIGAGYMMQQKAMWRIDTSNALGYIREDMKVFGVDLFYEAPFNDRGAAITTYLSYNNLDFGKNYVRMIATPNPASVGGNGFYGIGTGDIFYGQLAYLLGKNKDESKKARTQFYVASEVAVLDYLKTPMTMFEGGVNYYFAGKFGPKVTLGYQNRAVFENNGGSQLTETTRKGMYMVQFQVSF